MPDIKSRHIVEHQFDELAKRYTGLTLTRLEDGSYLITGDLSFSAEYNGEKISDQFALEITIPAHYPKNVPKVKEVGDRIPADFHKNGDGSLCLDMPIELRKIFHTEGTLSDFIDKAVVHFLYAFCYYKRHGEMPYGEWSHGGEGILEYYRQEFDIEDDLAVVGLLRILADDDYRGHIQCPCSSGKKLRKGHGEQLRQFAEYQTPGEFMYEYKHAAIFLVEKKIPIPQEFISKSLQKKSGRGRYGS